MREREREREEVFVEKKKREESEMKEDSDKNASPAKRLGGWGCLLFALLQPSCSPVILFYFIFLSASFVSVLLLFFTPLHFSGCSYWYASASVNCRHPLQYPAVIIATSSLRQPPLNLLEETNRSFLCSHSLPVYLQLIWNCKL